jgi:hypothetical protein
MRNGQSFCITLTLALALTSAASAQTQNTDPKTADPKACANGAPNSPGTLSDKLSQSSGVICPPNVDQGMKAPTPNTGKMPVIPPPGSPGGKPDVQPK